MKNLSILISLLFLLVLSGRLYDIYHDKQILDKNSCAIEACKSSCSGMSKGLPVFSRVQNITSWIEDGWIDCYCIGDTFDGKHAHFPLMNSRCFK